MSTWNDAIRRLVTSGVPLAAAWYEREFERRIDTFRDQQRALRTRYAVTADTPIRGYDAETRKAVLAYAESRTDVRLAKTSGSTSEPKLLAYPPERLVSFKSDSRSIGVRAWKHFQIRQPAIFVLSSLANDDSFTSLAVFQPKLPDRITGILEPARYLFQPALRRAISHYGPTAVRFWLMVLSNPGLLYSTNPSTLAVFLSEVHEDWQRSTSMIRDWTAGKRDPETQDLALRVVSAGFDTRMKAIAASSTALPFSEALPGVTAYCCWNGGYVVSFLRQIQRWLPPDRYIHIPMYAMSTETIQTLTWFGPTGEMRFLPMGPGVLYEFLPEDAEDRPEHLLEPHQLEVGHRYAMVVSDPYGLKRYQTEDLFECRGFVRGLPDLHFSRRRGLTWSFTGEKLTGEQLSEAYAVLEDEIPHLRAIAAQMTTLPTWPKGAEVPGYRLVIGHPGDHLYPPLDAKELEWRFDRALAKVNTEYAAKRETGRLAEPVVVILPYNRLAEGLDSASAAENRSWESQFKLAPLTRRVWEETRLGEVVHQKS